MPASNRFWEKPHDAPRTLAGFGKGDWFAHHTRGNFHSAEKILRQGMILPEHANPDANVVFFTNVETPLMGYDEWAEEGKGHVRILVSPDAPISRVKGTDWAYADKTVQPQHIIAIIAPGHCDESRWLVNRRENEKKEYLRELRAFLKQAEKASVPVYSLQGKRLWPPVPKEK